MDLSNWSTSASAMVEDIVLESPVQATSKTTPPPEDLRKVEYEYSLQPKFSPFIYHFQLFNKCFLAMTKTHKKSGQSIATAFHVGLLESQSKKHQSSAIWTFLGALLTAAAAGTLGFVLKDYLIAAATGALSLLLFTVHYFSYRKFSLFHTRSGKAPLVQLSHRCDCKKSLKAFIAKLEDRIRANTLPASSQFFAEETRWHRELKDQKWISGEEYSKARNRILRQFNRKTS
ncbi:MAG: hypothetical protein HWE27_01590 [Gammaproteobacteria bacterium]|nr:hypothetical protein [Gammaproteobacteria bacterium]